MITAVDTSIDDVVTSSHNIEKVIVEGSDEHLDVIIEAGTYLDRMVITMESLVQAIEDEFNEITPERGKELLVKLMPCFRACHQIIALIKKSRLYSGVKSKVTQLALGVEDLKEIASDISRYRVEENKEIAALINAINFDCA